MDAAINFILNKALPLFLIPGAEPVIITLLMIIFLLFGTLFFTMKTLISKDHALKDLNDKFQTALLDAHSKQINTLNMVNQTMNTQSMVTGELKSIVLCILAGRNNSLTNNRALEHYEDDHNA